MSLGQLYCQPRRVDLIQIDSKEQKEVYEINSVQCAQCEQLVDAWNPVGVLDVDQRAVRNTVFSVPLRTRNEEAIRLHVPTANAQGFTQGFEPLPRRA